MTEDKGKGEKGSDEGMEGRDGSIQRRYKIEQVISSRMRKEEMAKKAIMMMGILWSMAVLLASSFSGFSFLLSSSSFLKGLVWLNSSAKTEDFLTSIDTVQSTCYRKSNLSLHNNEVKEHEAE